VVTRQESNHETGNPLISCRQELNPRTGTFEFEVLARGLVRLEDPFDCFSEVMNFLLSPLAVALLFVGVTATTVALVGTTRLTTGTGS